LRLRGRGGEDLRLRGGGGEGLEIRGRRMGLVELCVDLKLRPRRDEGL